LEDAGRNRPGHPRGGPRVAAVGRRRQRGDGLFQVVRLRPRSDRWRHQEERSKVVDTSMLAFLAAPFVASLILTGIHAYLGVHVVERGVIFVDLSLAQIAAL